MIWQSLKERSLTLRLMGILSVSLIVFMLLSGFLYNFLIQQATVEHYSHVMERNAYAISQNLHDLLTAESNGSLDDTRLAVSWDTLTPYLALTEQITRCNVYLVDTHHRIIGYFDGVVQTLDHVLLTANLEQSIALGFMGKTPFISSGIGDGTRLTTSAPIMDQNSKVLGVVLLDVSLKELGYTQVSGTAMLWVSTVTAFAVAMILVLILSQAFTNPIRKTRQAALKLASGAYETRLPFKKNDEIGQLANSINILAERLEKARNRDMEIRKQQQQFFSMISHELRTPVTVIRGEIESLADGIIHTPEATQTAYKQMLAETTALQKLIMDLLELSRLQNPEFVIEMQPVNLSDLLSDVAMSANALCMQKRLIFQCAEPCHTFVVKGDERRLRQMLLAVIDNAVKFSKQGGKIELSCSDQCPAIIIRDEGCGIPDAVLPHIFDYFYHSGQRNSNGTGIGLALVQEIARRHKIDIHVTSSVGVGTAFEFVFQTVMVQENQTGGSERTVNKAQPELTT